MNDEQLEEWETILSEMTNMVPVKKVTKRKVSKVKSTELSDVNIRPVSNGYIVTSSTTGRNEYVFDNIDKAFDFIKGKLKPTAEQSEFLEQV